MSFLACSLITAGLLTQSLSPATDASGADALFEQNARTSSAAPSATEPSPRLELAPPPYVETQPTAWLIGLGAVSGSLSYGLAFAPALFYGALIYPIYAVVTDDVSFSSGMAWLFVPIVGPFLSARTELMRGSDDLRTLLYINGGIQVASLGLIIAGFLIRQPVVANGEQSAMSVGPGPEGSAGLTLTLRL